MKNQNIIIFVLLLVVGGISFFAGTKYQLSKSPSLTGFPGAGGRGAMNLSGAPQFRNRADMNQIMGEIISLDDTSITVKLTDGSTKIVLVSDSTTYNKSEAGSLTDIAVGSRIAVFGKANTEGTVEAQTVQINPTFRGPDISPQPTE